MTVEMIAPAPSTLGAAVRIETTLGNLLPSLKAAGVGMATRPPIPVLTFVRLETEGHVTTASCFDYATSGSSEFVSDVPSYGSILLPYRQLVDLLTAAGKGTTKRIRESWTVTIEAGETSHTVTVNGTVYNLMAGPLDEYPTLPDLETGEETVVDTAKFIRLMDAAAVAASKDDTLPILSGVHLEVSNNLLTVHSTDRYRLFESSMPVFGISEMTLLVPVKAWKKIRKHLNPKIDTVVRFNKPSQHSPGRISFHNETVSSALEPDGAFPKLGSLFPDSTAHRFVFMADDMAAAVAALIPVIERNTPVRLTYGTDDVLTLDGGTGEDAQAKATVLYVNHGAKLTAPVTTAFNPHFLLEGAQLYKGETVSMGVQLNTNKPAVIDPWDGEPMRYLMMPVRLPGQ